jgi:hypothetical protein
MGGEIWSEVVENKVPELFDICAFRALNSNKDNLSRAVNEQVAEAMFKGCVVENVLKRIQSVHTPCVRGGSTRSRG